MGLFDESDDDDHENDLSKSSAGGIGGIGGGYGDDDDGEEEDPLDAYMKSLEAPAPPSSSSPAKAGGRLDHDAEEEATSHWQLDRKSAGSSSKKSGARLLSKVAGFDNEDEDDEEDDDGFGHSRSHNSGAQEARTAMSSTFVRAGGNKRNNNKNNGTDDGGAIGADDAGEFDEIDFSKLSKQQHDKHLQMQHEEVDPLEKINHKLMKYAPFRRQFYTPPNTEAGHAWRKEHEVTCTPANMDPILGFGELDEVRSYSNTANDNNDNTSTTKDQEHHAICPPELLKTIAKQGYTHPTCVQSQTLPIALSGHDALITASTGSGKTLSYIWPLVIHISDQPYIQPGIDGPIGIILTPTRELAKQVYKYAKIFVECIGGKVVEVAGGNKGTWELIKELKKGCEVLVGTPGRVIDVVKKKGTNLGRVTFVVLDEADRMLDMGFEKQVSSILENIRPDRQTLLLSATFAKRVEKVARSWLRDPVRIAIGRTGASSEHVDQHCMVLPSRDSKIQWLVEILPILSPLGRCLVFVATRADCDLLAQMVQSSPAFTAVGGANSSIIVSIHGDKDQSDRNSAIAQFKKNSQAILIATDVAARGLDIPNVMTVINFDAAKNIDSHVHRVGRAGRLQKDATNDDGHQRGTAYTLLTEKDADFAQSLVDAFEREGRIVSQELTALCQKSKRYGGGRAKNSKTGLGFGSGSSNHHAIPGHNSGSMSYYSDNNNDGPVAKRSRWG